MITKIVTDQVNTPTTAGTASSISDATCVRLFNNTVGVVTVGISSLVGAGSTNYFAIPAGTVEFLAKPASDVIWTSSVIRANKVAFTN